MLFTFLIVIAAFIFNFLNQKHINSGYGRRWIKNTCEMWLFENPFYRYIYWSSLILASILDIIVFKEGIMRIIKHITLFFLVVTSTQHRCTSSCNNHVNKSELVRYELFREKIHKFFALVYAASAYIKGYVMINMIIESYSGCYLFLRTIYMSLFISCLVAIFFEYLHYKYNILGISALFIAPLFLIDIISYTFLTLVVYFG